MFGERDEHMIEETDTCIDVTDALTINIDGDVDIRLKRLALHRFLSSIFHDPCLADYPLPCKVLPTLA